MIEDLREEAPEMRPENLSNFRKVDGHPAGERTNRSALWTNLRSAALRAWPEHLIVWYAVLIAAGFYLARRSRAAAICLILAVVGILGAGVQGRMQLEWLRRVRPFREAVVWGVDESELAAYRRDMEAPGFAIRTTRRAEDVAEAANLIVTCTPSTKPLLMAEWIRPGTHITAVGSDTAEKQELDPAILARADRIVVDSLSQSEMRGEVYRAVRAGAIGRDRLIELGRVIEDPRLRRASDDEITVADLTGVAVQDIMISQAVFNAVTHN